MMQIVKEHHIFQIFILKIFHLLRKNLKGELKKSDEILRKGFQRKEDD